MKNFSELKEAMMSLLDIYNLNLDLQKPEDWPWKKIKRNLNLFLNSIFDRVQQRCCYRISEKKMLITIDANKSLITLPPIQTGMEEINMIYDLFDLLKQEVDMDLIHFVVKELNTHIQVEREEKYPDDYFKSDNQIFYEFFEKQLHPLINTSDDKKTKNTKLLSILYSFLKHDSMDIDLIDPILSKITGYNEVPAEETSKLFDELEKTKEYIYNRNSEPNLFNQMQYLSYKTIKKTTPIKKKQSYSNLYAQNYSLLTVDPCTQFAKKLIYYTREKHSENIFFEINPTDEKGIENCTVPSLDFSSWKSFHEILKSFLVEYCFASDQFKNIKLCENLKCQKLMLEERRNQKQFCGNKCRQAFFKKDPKNKCRDNQNQWIRGQFNSDSTEIINYFENNFKTDSPTDTLKKENAYSGNRIVTADCSDCMEPVSRGYCEKITIKNPALIDINPKRKKKTTKK